MINLILKQAVKEIYFFSVCFFLAVPSLFSQGLNSTWLLGYDYSSTSDKGRLIFNNGTYNLLTEQRKIPFEANTQATISNENGDLLMSTNGVWIANTSGDTMANGGGLNPNTFTSAWFAGLPIANGAVFLPYPGDSSKYILFHQTGNYSTNLASTELFFSIVDMSIQGGLGEVVQKNQIILQDTLGWGLSACKHANGRDWWIIALDDSINYAYEILLTPTGIDTVIKQYLPFMPPYSQIGAQPVFSPDGKQFAVATGYGITPDFWYHDIRKFSFDRCTGNLSSAVLIDLTDSVPGFGAAFSPDSRFLYTCSFEKVFQINTATNAVDTIAYYDRYNSPFSWCCPTIFYLMYLANNGKIYITSGNGVQHLHEMNYPDSAGVACDLQQHAIALPCYNKGATPNHPNYYLGCDTTQTSCPCLLTQINDLSPPDFKYKVYPNPIIDGILNIGYVLPQNKSGAFELFDVTGKSVFKYALPAWSNMQSFMLSALGNGIYNCVISSGDYRATRKIAVIKK